MIQFVFQKLSLHLQIENNSIIFKYQSHSIVKLGLKCNFLFGIVNETTEKISDRDYHMTSARWLAEISVDETKPDLLDLQHDPQTSAQTFMQH